MHVQHIACGAFANESERKAFQAISLYLRSIPTDGTSAILTNLAHHGGPGRQPDEIDMVVLGDQGVIVIEVKHWDRARLLSARPDAEEAAELIAEKAKRVASKLKKIAPQLGFVPGAILLTKEAKSTIENGRPREVGGIKVFSLNDISALFSSVRNQHDTTASLEAMVRQLAPRQAAVTATLPSRIGKVAELRLLSLPTEKFARVFSGRDQTTGDRVSLFLYDLSAAPVHNPERLARREYDAVQKLQKAVCLPSLVESFQHVPGYQGEMYFFTIADSAAQPLGEAASDENWSIEARVKFAAQACRDLRGLHAPSDPDQRAIVHRALNADTVRVRANGRPLFAGWGWARIEDAGTVAPMSAGIVDEFAAPEVSLAGLQAADARSDIYSLAKTLSYVFAGDDVLNADARSILEGGMAVSPEDRAPLEQLALGLEGLLAPGAALPPATQDLDPSRWDEGYVLEFNGERYRVVSRLGEGAIGRTFKLEQLEGETDAPIGTFVGKVVVDQKYGTVALRVYQKIRSVADHPNLSGVFEVAKTWSPDQLVALLKWRKGEPLETWRGEYFQLYAEDVERSVGLGAEDLALTWARQILEALNVLHSQGWVHGDISPANIIADGENVFLIDFDLAGPVGEVAIAPGTRPYASDARFAEAPAQFSDDVFALAASFFHVLTDRLPFVVDGVRRQEKGFAWRELETATFPRLVAFLNRAAASQPDQRFQSASEALTFMKSLSAPAVQVEPEPAQASEIPSDSILHPNVVDRVIDILRTYPGSRFGNAETRGLDTEFAHGTYVETRLDRDILDTIKQDGASLVILCGNAGDGKTALLQHLVESLGIAAPKSSERLWSASVNGRVYNINLDGAASWQGRSADDLMDEIFAPFHDGAPKRQTVHLVAVNDGRLMEWVESYEQRHGATMLTEQLLDALNGEPEALDDHVRLIELNDRSLVGGFDPTSGVIATEFLENLVFKLIGGERAGEIWKPCMTCSAQSRCTMRASAMMFGASADPQWVKRGELLRARLTLALQAVHQRNEVHITARELKASLSYILFGLHACQDLHDQPTVDGHCPADYAFDADSPARQGELLRELTRLDPALGANARVDRYLAGRASSDPNHGAPRFPDLPLTRARRQAFFVWSDDQVAGVGGSAWALGLHGGRWFSEFGRFPRMTAAERMTIRDAICRGLSRLEALPEIASETKGVMPLRVVPRTPTETAFWVGKPLSRFTLVHESFEADAALETLHRKLVLTYRGARDQVETLSISLELFGLLRDLAEGIQIMDAFSDDVFGNIGVFTQRLAQEDETFLLAWNPANEETIFGVGIERRTQGQTLTLSEASSGASVS